LEKERRTLKKWVRFEKNKFQLEKFVTLRKIGSPCKNGSNLVKGVTIVKIGHNWKNGYTQKRKWAKLGKKGKT